MPSSPSFSQWNSTGTSSTLMRKAKSISKPDCQEDRQLDPRRRSSLSSSESSIANPSSPSHDSYHVTICEPTADIEEGDGLFLQSKLLNTEQNSADNPPDKIFVSSFSESKSESELKHFHNKKFQSGTKYDTLKSKYLKSSIDIDEGTNSMAEVEATHANASLSLSSKSHLSTSSDLVEIQHYAFHHYNDFETIDEVEWGPRKGEPGYDDQQELAPRPRRAKQDPCGCQPVGIEYTDNGIIICPEVNGSSPQLMACRDDSCILYAIQEECSSTCEAGPTCGNKRLQRRQFCDVEVFDAGFKGKGLRLSKSGTCNRGDMVCEYVGRAIKASHLQALFRRYQHDRRLYIMALGDGVYLDARHKGSVARFINHSCNPNCRVERWKVKGIVRAAVVALRDIAPQEEFTFDYQWERKRGHAPTICYCGTTACRGTLEAPKSLEEQDLQKELEGHWEKRLIIDHSIVNRTVQVYSNEHKEYFIGEITGFDIEKKMHCIFYRHDMSEVWEDLKKEDWMILSEKKDKEEFRIARKQRQRLPSRCVPTIPLKDNMTTAPTQSLVKNYIYVQTPIKEAFWSHHLIERCERNCCVRIHAEQQARPPLPMNPDDPEEVEKYSSLNVSLDGTVWKLTITGSDVPKALTILEKNRAHLERKFAFADETVRMNSALSLSTNTNLNRLLHTSSLAGTEIHEVIFPRPAADLVKRRINMVREKCRNVSISFLASDSKSKQFAKISLEGPFSSDVEIAKELLWNLLLQTCADRNLPMTSNMMYRDLGFLGGNLTNKQFQLLCQNRNNRLNNGAREDLHESSFVRSFESTCRCTLWIQSQEDQGRIDSSNHIVNVATPNALRKFFLGCAPIYVSKLANQIQIRALEMERGVKYIYLGIDHVYQACMMKNGGVFFDFIRSVTGALVSVDSMTGDHLRIDGRIGDDNDVVLEEEIMALSEGQRADLAEELIRLQIEVYRDHCTRQSPWIFGKDWSLVTLTHSIRGDTDKVGAGTIGILDRRVGSFCALDIAEIVTRCHLPVTVAAHSTLILYRFLFATETFSTQMKSREAVLACVFLANKMHLAVDFKPLEVILEAGYNTFYPGSRFVKSTEEAFVLEERVLMAEKEILDTLKYDVFWQNIRRLRIAATGSGKMRKETVDCAVEFAFSGQVLSSGAELWLKYGVEYVFAVSAAFLKADLAELLPALSLFPLKVYQAAELLVNSAKLGRPSNKKNPSHNLLEGGTERLKKYLPRIKDACDALVRYELIHSNTLSNGSASIYEMSYRDIVANNNQYHIVREVPQSLLKNFVCTCDKIAVESTCNIFIGCGTAKDDTGEIVLNGSWRSVSVAYHLLRGASRDRHDYVLPKLQELSPEDINQVSLQAKAYPGLLNSIDIETSAGWKNSIQLSFDTDARDLGGKYYVAAKVCESALRKAGSRWLIPPMYAVGRSADITDICFPEKDTSRQLSFLGDLAASLVGKSDVFAQLSARRLNSVITDRSMPVSVQRWPPEKVLSKETQKLKKLKTKGVKMGFSPAALREMQLLREIHCLIPLPQGHPNFVLPVGIAVPAEKDDGSSSKKSPEPEIEMSPDDAVFSLFRSSDENEKTAKRSKKIKEAPSLIFQSAPFTLHRILSRRVNVVNERISPIILSAWFHDCLSMVALFHCSNIVLCTLQLDQIMIDQCGVAKLGSLYRCRCLTDSSNGESILELTETVRDLRRKEELDDYSTDHYVAPETLLGSLSYSKESDMWAVGSLFANLLLNKPMFSGKDRESFLTSQYKIVGTPARSNFPDAVKFPYYFKPIKKYVSTVEKALRKLMKEEADYEKAIDLVAKMLRLDPVERITATEALNHEFFQDFRNHHSMPSFRHQYAEDWIKFKESLINSISDENRIENKKLVKRNFGNSTAGDDINQIVDGSCKKQRKSEFSRIDPIK